MAKNNWLFGCMRCIIYGASQNTTMIDSYACSAIGSSGLVAINCSGLVFDSSMSGFTFNLNGRVLKEGWDSFNSSTASALAPKALGGRTTVKNYEVDLSGGTCYVNFDTTLLDGCAITFKIVGAGGNLVISTATGSGTFEQIAVPQTISAPSLLDSYTIGINGTKLYII